MFLEIKNKAALCFYSYLNQNVELCQESLNLPSSFIAKMLWLGRLFVVVCVQEVIINQSFVKFQIQPLITVNMIFIALIGVPRPYCINYWQILGESFLVLQDKCIYSDIFCINKLIKSAVKMKWKWYQSAGASYNLFCIKWSTSLYLLNSVKLLNNTRL